MIAETMFSRIMQVEMEIIMLNIAICDDDTFFCESIRLFFKNKYNNIIHSIEDFSNGYELIHDIEQNHSVYNFIFLDIDMPVMNGIDTGFALRHIPSHHNAVIFFMTCFDTPSSAIIDIHPFTYLQKPVDNNLFDQKFNTALSFFYDDEKYMILNSKTAVYQLPPKKILYIASAGRKSEIHFVNRDTYLINIKLSDISKTMLDKSYQFVQPHKSFIANCSYIRKVTNTMITLTDNTSIPLSKTYRNDFFCKFREFYIH